MQKILAIFIVIASFLFFAPPSFAATRIPILMYHHIRNCNCPNNPVAQSLSVSPAAFDAQMGYLASHGYTPISLDTMYAVLSGQAQSPPKPVVLTFDDGYIDFYTIAFPILRRFNFHAVSFIPTGLMGGSYYMNWDQIKEIASTGLVTFEGHTVTHSNLVSLGYTAALKQLVDSKNIIQEHTGYPVNFVAYPFGSTNGIVQSITQNAGYIGGVGTWSGKAWGPFMNMPRIKVSGFWSLKEFASRL